MHYDDLGRLDVAVADALFPGGQDVTAARSYDGDNRDAGWTLYSGSLAAGPMLTGRLLGYNDAGWVTSVTHLAEGRRLTATTQYLDAAGRDTRMTRRAGAGTVGLQSSVLRDAAGRVTSIEHGALNNANSVDEVFKDFSLQYDDAGRLERFADAAADWHVTYDFDWADQLTDATDLNRRT